VSSTLQFQGEVSFRVNIAEVDSMPNAAAALPLRHHPLSDLASTKFVTKGRTVTVAVVDTKILPPSSGLSLVVEPRLVRIIHFC